jgi:hypothetical protein
MLEQLTPYSLQFVQKASPGRSDAFDVSYITLRIFLTCATLVSQLLAACPTASFVVNGAQSRDFQANKIERRENTQRFRVYKNIAAKLFGRERFEHYEFVEISSYVLVNKTSCTDISAEVERIRNILIDRYNIEL